MCSEWTTDDSGKYLLISPPVLLEVLAFFSKAWPPLADVFCFFPQITTPFTRSQFLPGLIASLMISGNVIWVILTPFLPCVSIRPIKSLYFSGHNDWLKHKHVVQFGPMTFRQRNFVKSLWGRETYLPRNWALSSVNLERPVTATQRKPSWQWSQEWAMQNQKIKNWVLIILVKPLYQTKPNSRYCNF